MGSEYLVVKFLMYDNDEFVVVPKSWTWLNSDEDTAVSYPEEIPARTRKRVENNEPCSRDWKMFRVSVIHCADSYKDARKMILNLSNTTEMNSSVDPTTIDGAYIDEVSSLISNLSITDPDECDISDDTKSETKNNKTTPILQDVIAIEINETKENKVENVHENGDINIKENTKNYVKENKGIKGNVNVKGVKGTKNKDKVDEIDKYKSSKRILKSPFKEDAPKTKSTLRYAHLIELVPGSNVFIDAEELEECKASSNNRDELVLSLMKAIFTNEGLVRCLLSITEECSNDTPSLNKNVLRAIVSYVKDMNDKKWSNKDKKLSSKIKHPYLTKLIHDSNVLVNAKDILEAVSSANGSRSRLACALMGAVFTKESLRNCLAEDAKVYNSNEADTMPKLDETGTEAILKFVETIEDDEQNRWNAWDKKSVVKAMNNELEKWRSMWYFQKV